MDNHAEKSHNALVLCGGGSRGAAEIGFYQALMELGFSLDFIVGTSVGAVIGAYIAAGLKAEEILQLWNHWCQIKGFHFNWKILWKRQRVDSLLVPKGFRQFLDRTLPVKTFEKLNLPLTMIATDLQTGMPIYLEEGELIPAIMASCAVPLLLPPVVFQGHQLVDGGVTNNVALDVAFAKGAKRIYGILCHCQEELQAPVQGLVKILGRVFHVASRQKLQRDKEKLKGKVEMILLEPCLTSSPDFLGFQKSQTIISEAYEFSLKYLKTYKGVHL